MVYIRNSLIEPAEQINLDNWIQKLQNKNLIKDLPLIQKALELANLSAKNITPLGKSCLYEGLAMADILSGLGVDDNTLAASIVYSSSRHTDLSLEDISEYLNKDIGELIHNVNELDGITELTRVMMQKDYQQQKVDNIRRMLLAMVKDMRSVLIKLAEHLYVLRNMRNLDKSKQVQIAGETMDLYAPLANRLGFGSLKWEMEDLAFKSLNPEKYKEISKALNQRRIDRENYVQQTVKTLRVLIQRADIRNVRISGRAKHIYSIYRKMQKKSLTFASVYDVVAVRIIIPTVEDCYKILSTIHTKWRHVPQEFDDYIATPKENGYKSIHTVILGPEHKHVEIQIRTAEMHQEAELGGAAHWVYKEGKAEDTYANKIKWLRQVMDWRNEVADKSVIQKVFGDRVYVFTPAFDVVDLPKGSTPIDFAYYIHTGVGHRCRGAKVNGEIVNLTYQLKTGERVEILTAKEPHPSRDWLRPALNYLHTTKAKAKVQQWFKQLEDEAKETEIKAVPQIKKSVPAKPSKTKAVAKTKELHVKIFGVNNTVTSFANCCRPKLGDAIVGYITLNRGITIHRQDCFNVARVKYKDRLLKVEWKEA